MKDISLHILDIAQNSIRAEASLITINIAEDINEDQLVVSISDNGKGMTLEQAAHVTDPYVTSRSTRKVGLGLPLFKQSAEQSGGTLTIKSVPCEGTAVIATFRLSHIDRPPLGDTANAVALLSTANPQCDFVYNHQKNGKQYTFDTREVKAVLDGWPLSNPHIFRMIEEMINENLKILTH